MTDLKNWSEINLLSVKDYNINYCSPGNVIEHNGEFVLCFTSYPMPYTFQEWWCADETARIFIMRTKDFSTFTEPEILNPKGDIPIDELGRMIDPFIIKKDNEFYLFFKQDGVSLSKSKNLTDWEYIGRTDGGENACVIEKDGEYILVHSPANGVSFSKSKDLYVWEDAGFTTLDQKNWDWAQRRLTAGFVMEAPSGCRHRYILFFHGSVDVYPETHGNSTLAAAFTDDFENFYYEV